MPRKIDKLMVLGAQLKGCLVMDRTKGGVSVHGDHEGENTLSINRMHSIVTGKRTPKKQGNLSDRKSSSDESYPARYAERFQFKLHQGEQRDLDVTIETTKGCHEEAGRTWIDAYFLSLHHIILHRTVYHDGDNRVL